MKPLTTSLRNTIIVIGIFWFVLAFILVFLAQKREREAFYATLIISRVGLFCETLGESISEKISAIEQLINHSGDKPEVLFQGLDFLPPEDLYYILDTNGRIMAIRKGYEAYMGLDLSRASYVREESRGTEVRQSFFSRHPVVIWVWRLSQGETLVVEMDLNFIAQVANSFERALLGREGTLFVLSQTGSVVYHPEEEIVNTRHNLGFEMVFGGRIEDLGLSQISFHGRSYFAYSRRIPYVAGWQAYYVVPVADVWRAVFKDTFLAGVAMGGILVLILFSIHHLLSRRFSHPVTRLVEAIAELEKRPTDALVPEHVAGQTREIQTIVRAINDLVTDLRRANEELLASKEGAEEVKNFLETIIGNLSIGLAVLDPDGRIRLANPALCTMVEKDEEDMVNRPCYQAIRGRETPCPECALEEVALGKKNASRAIISGTRGEETFYYEVILSPVRDYSGEVRQIIELVRDITEMKRAEEEKEALQAQLIHAQKMEAIGRLTAGICHDFNNILMAVMGNVELLLYSVEEDDPAYRRLMVIKEAVERANRLTRDLLAFSRRQIFSPQVLDVNELIAKLENLLKRTLGEDIRLRLNLAERIWPIKADPSHLEQIILNLAVNAREAMVEGGELLLKTENIEVDEAWAERYQMPPGAYVRLTVTDTGCGIPEEILDKIFEPFFTTKKEGTGLGLATVYGIVKQNMGHISVFSRPGEGTTFYIYLPRADEAMVVGEERLAEKPVLGGQETILVVEDEEWVRNLIVEVLTAQGYQVLSAEDGHQALMLAENHSGPIHLIVSDIVMPGLKGPELVKKLRQTRPDMAALLISGYPKDSFNLEAMGLSRISFLPKPFVTKDFLLRIREILDACS
ncbi:ATP-binding protein [Thermosulfuriphilus sp.]